VSSSFEDCDFVLSTTGLLLAQDALLLLLMLLLLLLLLQDSHFGSDLTTTAVDNG